VRLAGIAAATVDFDRIGVDAPVTVICDVGVDDRLPERVPARDRAATSSASSARAPACGSVIADAGDALRLEVQRRQLAHLAGADDEHAPPGELSEIFRARLTAAKRPTPPLRRSAVSDRTRACPRRMPSETGD
jgi:hypothetical protein